jgi:nicotinate phosphoribosyltransferase
VAATAVTAVTMAIQLQLTKITTAEAIMLNNISILTDLYQLTMAQAFWDNNKQDLQASFYMHFRENPFDGGYAIACGIAQLADYIQNFQINQSDVDYLCSVKAADGTPLFDPNFLVTLPNKTLQLDIDAVAEGTAVFPYEPIIRVSGPISQCLLIETALLNIVNFETLIATKAARVCSVANGPVAEFGLRRAQGPNGGNSASRAAIVGGCASTSNVMAGKLYDLPISGTHSHAWVMAFDSELEAFRSYANSFAHNCILLVDTYNTFKGIANAIIVAHEMENRGQRLTGIRIDSGDLAWLSIQAREQLDAAGLDYVKIFASNDLDEYTIHSLLTEQDARIDAWGVGTRLACAYNQPALGGVYKLSAIKQPGQSNYTPVIKESEQLLKSTMPGLLAVRRYFYSNGKMAGDMVYDIQNTQAMLRPQFLKNAVITDPFNELRQKDLSNLEFIDLLEPLIRSGQPLAKLPSPLQAQANTLRNLQMLHPANKRLLNPHIYPVGMERSLLEQRDKLLSRAHNS